MVVSVDEEPIRGNATAKPIIIIIIIIIMIIIIIRPNTIENITVKSVCFSDRERLFTHLHYDKFTEKGGFSIQCERNDCIDHVLTTCANGNLSNETKISESAYFCVGKVVHSDKKRRTKRQHSNVLNDDMNSESESSCESKIGHFSSLTGAEAVHSNKNKECKDNILMCQMTVKIQ